MTSDVSQQRAADQLFTVNDLHQFVDQANREGLVDETEVTCTVSFGTSVFSLHTFVGRSEARDHSHVTPTPSGLLDPDNRTTIEQSATGPLVHYRHWLRTRSVHMLLLGDVRALLARIYQAGLPLDHYEIAALPVPGSRRQLVYSISARPRKKVVAHQETNPG